MIQSYPEAVPVVDSRSSDVPARVRAALMFCELARQVTTDYEGGTEYARPVGRQLTTKEEATYTAALGLLARYFHCELDFGDLPPRCDAATEPAPGAAEERRKAEGGGRKEIDPAEVARVIRLVQAEYECDELAAGYMVAVMVPRAYAEFRRQTTG